MLIFPVCKITTDSNLWWVSAVIITTNLTAVADSMRVCTITYLLFR